LELSRVLLLLHLLLWQLVLLGPWHQPAGVKASRSEGKQE
jgi:hypothetical protein